MYSNNVKNVLKFSSDPLIIYINCLLSMLIKAISIFEPYRCGYVIQTGQETLYQKASVLTKLVRVMASTLITALHDLDCVVNNIWLYIKTSL